jgi:hypothetical protein
MLTHTTVTVHVAEHTLTLEAGDNDTRTVSRTTTTVGNIGPVRPRKAAP